MSIILYNDSGDQIVSQCVVKDRVTVQQIYDCLIPHEHSKIAMDLLGSGPVIGKLGFQVANGTTWVEFVDAGMNSLCFQVREVAYIRGGAGYQSYRSDHKRLYGIDSARVAEGMVFHEKLSQICKKQQE
ncbi:hypothetical protein V5E97_07400 [Singulisphaera sp. Ch08]|uniref:Uncharacterized protein n=1 Tax=Singulisphaera sp. Ch08 TaxID=3120278 RepID=A0AAU7CL44_9BACT